jgi:hypothetical protein
VSEESWADPGVPSADLGVEVRSKRSQKPLRQATRVMNRSRAFWGVS